jgi:hypothetical protein
MIKNEFHCGIFSPRLAIQNGNTRKTEKQRTLRSAECEKELLIWVFTVIEHMKHNIVLYVFYTDGVVWKSFVIKLYLSVYLH